MKFLSGKCFSQVNIKFHRRVMKNGKTILSIDIKILPEIKPLLK